MAVACAEAEAIEVIPATLCPQGVFWQEFYADLIKLHLYEDVASSRSFLLATYRTGRQLEGPVCQTHVIQRVGAEKVGIATVSLLPKDQLLVNLYVKPAYRHAGYGAALLREVQRRYPTARGVYTATAQHLYGLLKVLPLEIKDIPPAIQVARSNLLARTV